MILIYCDHNFLVTANQSPEAYKRHLVHLAESGLVKFVLSPMHWIEAAEDRDAVRGAAMADLMDSIAFRWLYYRRTIQQKEVLYAFLRFNKIETSAPIMVGSMNDVVTALGATDPQFRSRDFVAHLRDIGPTHPLRVNLQSAFKSNQQNRAKYLKGKITPAVARRVRQLYVTGLLPDHIPDAEAARFTNAMKADDFPSIEMETKAAYNSWQQGRAATRNNFVDEQHVVMASPYVDFVVTNDVRLR